MRCSIEILNETVDQGIAALPAEPSGAFVPDRLSEAGERLEQPLGSPHVGRVPEALQHLHQDQAADDDRANA